MCVWFLLLLLLGSLVLFSYFYFYIFYFILKVNKAPAALPLLSELSILSDASHVRFAAVAHCWLVHFAQHPTFGVLVQLWLVTQGLLKQDTGMVSGGVPSSAVLAWWPCSCPVPVSLLPALILWGEDFPSQCGFCTAQHSRDPVPAGNTKATAG